MDTMETETTITPAQHDFLIDLGATPEDIDGITKIAASKLIDTLKAERDALEQLAQLEAQATIDLRVADYQLEIVTRNEPLPATRRNLKRGYDLERSVRIVSPEGGPRLTIMTNTVTVGDNVFFVEKAGSSYRGEGGDLVDIPRTSGLARDIAICLREVR